MDRVPLVCPECHQAAKVIEGRVQPHKIVVTLSGGAKVKVKCPGIGKRAV